jgi:hypothetical protein
VKFKQLRAHFKLKPAEASAPKTLLRKCHCCGEGNLVTLATFDGRGPPAEYMGVCQNLIPYSVAKGWVREGMHFKEKP